VRAGTLGRARPDQASLLDSLGFAKQLIPEDIAAPVAGVEMLPRGEAFDEAWSVLGQRETALALFREAMLELPATQALIQALHGRGNVAVGGALHLLAKHKLADADDVTEFRGFLQTLNDVGIVAYSKRMQTVRIVVQMPNEEDEVAGPTVKIVTPDRPYQNVRHLREILRGCKDFIWWSDPNFEKRGFEPLEDEADATKISEIRILSSGRPDAGSVKDYGRFRQEMKNLGITVEWRYVPEPDRDWHDRFIVTKSETWNVPPVGTILKGSYSEFKPTTPPPFEEWWEKGAPV
jgi:hypothetical protein